MFEGSWFSLSTPMVSASHAPEKTTRAAALLSAWELEPADLFVGDNPADVIGEGGQAVVRRGKWNGVDIAAKIPRSMRHGEAMSQMLRREVRALARVRHPNVVRLYGACMEQPPCLVMAYAAGGALDDAVRAGPHLHPSRRRGRSSCPSPSSGPGPGPNLLLQPSPSLSPKPSRQPQPQPQPQPQAPSLSL